VRGGTQGEWIRGEEKKEKGRRKGKYERKKRK
jgi:hypothetical protein